MNRPGFGCPARSFLSLCMNIHFLLALLLFGPVPSAFSASITVNADQIKGYINPLVFGQNVMYNANTMWDHTKDTLKSDTEANGVNVKSKIQALAPTILRFPGGTAADLCFWEDGLGLRTTNQLEADSPEIRLDDKPKSWKVLGNGKNNFGLLIQPKTLAYETLLGQLGDSFIYTGKDIDNKKLNLPNPPLLNPPSPENLYPPGVCVRPGGRMWKDTEYTVFSGDGKWDNTYGIVEHLKLVNSLGAEALLTVNYLTGMKGESVWYDWNDPSLDQRIKRAQALVAFCNGRTNDTRLLGLDDGNIDWYTVGYWARKRAALGFPLPFNVRYWQVGNEPYYNCEITDSMGFYVGTVPAATAEIYDDRFNSFAQKMKDVDPKIRVGAAGMRPDQTSNQGESSTIWNTTVLDTTQNDLDFLSIHPYYPSATEEQAGGGYDNPIWFKAVMAGATQALLHLNTIRGTIDDIASSRKNNIGLAVTEFGIWPSDSINDPSTQWVDESAYDYSNLARALYDADLLLGLIKGKGLKKEDNGNIIEDKPLRLTAATTWNLHGNIATSSIGFNWFTSKRIIRPQYHAFKMLRENLASKRLVQADVVSGYFDTEDQVGNVERLSVKYLEALGALSADGQSLTLVVINRSLTGDITATIQITGAGFSPQPNATVTVLGYKNTQAPPHFNVIGDHNEDDVSPINTVEPVSYTIFNASGNFSYPFRAHSLTIIEFIAQ